MFFSLEILLMGTGRTMSLPPPSLRSYMNEIGIQMDFMDTVRLGSF
jgi:NADH dehydrogenase [ubiquinone] 1 alpha subcomplex assembly factor 3